MDYYGKGGLSSAIDKLLNYEKVSEDFNVTVEQLTGANGNVNIRVAQLWWYFRILATSHPLEQKMTLFWHDHFATSAQKVDSPPIMLGHIEALRSHSMGTFHDLLMAVSQDPGMLYWLDNNENVKGKPNENFAREIMELFTLGIGHYSEKDVQEAARAFTGWTIGVRRGQRTVPSGARLPRNAAFLNVPARHDEGEKQVLGNKGQFHGEDIVGILCGNPQTAKYIVGKIWKWFVYPNPEPALIDGLASRWRSNGMVIKDLLRWIMESPEFYSDKAYRAVVKNPIDFVVPIMRQLGVGGRALARVADAEPGARAAAPVAPLVRSTRAMGMELLFPPDVDGWVSGQDWISTATMVERVKFANDVFPDRAGGAALGLNLMNLFANDPTPRGVVEKLLSVFDIELAPAKVEILVKAAESKAGGPRINQRTASPTANAVAKLIFGSPEFQFG